VIPREGDRYPSGKIFDTELYGVDRELYPRVYRQELCATSHIFL